MTAPAPLLTKHVYAPRGAAAAVFRMRDGEILLSGPAGTGKSRACLEKLLLQALKYPGMRGLIARKTHSSLTSTTLVTWREKVAAEALAAKICWFYGGSAQEAAQYRFANGSSITIGGLDNPTKIMSSEYDVVYVGEAIELDVTDWESITSRLRNGKMPYQQLLADTNPERPEHWLKQRCDAGKTVFLESRHTDNPLYVDAAGAFTDLGKQYVLGKLANLTGVRRDRLYLGRWVAAEGQIYETYDPVLHLVDPAPIPAEWPRYWSVDFGYTNPFVCQHWAQDPDGRLVLYREFYRTQRLVEDHCRDILGVVAPGGVWREPRPAAVVCDHDAEGRATLERHLGLSTRPALKMVTEGIQAVQSRLKAAGDGRPRLLFMRDALVSRDGELGEAGKPTSTVGEIVGYVWADSRKKEEPVKADDHGMDAMRYMIVNLDMAPRPQLRWL